MHSSGFFRIKPIARLILKREISGSHTISDQSLLLSTIVLNDTPKRKKKKTAQAILLGEDEDDSMVFTTSEEFDKYLKETPLKSSENCLERWFKHINHAYPNLAKLAKRIPATSVPAEQVFSVAGKIVNTKRACLKPENIDLLIFLNKNSV